MRIVESALVYPLVIFLVLLSFAFGMGEYEALGESVEEHRTSRENAGFSLPKEVLLLYSFASSSAESSQGSSE